MNDLVSIVISCFNEERYIEGCILSLASADYQNIEILIVDGGSTDGTLQILANLQKRYSAIQILSNPQRVTPISLNIGVRNASGSYIMIASAHSQYPQNYISFLLQQLDVLKCDVVGGSIQTEIKNSNPKSEAIVTVLSNRFGVGNSHFRTEKDATLFVDTVPFGIYRKTVFDVVGYYNEQLIRNHDIELSKRITRNGFKIVLVSSMRCVYYAREDYIGLAKNNFSNGYWNLLTVYITKDFRSLSLRHFIPLVFILSLIVPAILSLFINGFIIILSLFFFLSYILFVLIISFYLLNPRIRLLNIVLGFITLHFSYGIGSLFGLFNIKKLFK